MENKDKLIESFQKFVKLANSLSLLQTDDLKALFTQLEQTLGIK